MSRRDTWKAYDIVVTQRGRVQARADAVPESKVQAVRKATHEALGCKHAGACVFPFKTCTGGYTIVVAEVEAPARV
jgi:hypothetical protein